MPAYTSLNTQIEAVKSEIATSLAASTYTAQDLVYIAKALETLGNLLGINDLVAASADAQASLTTYVSNVLNGTYDAVVNKIYVGEGSQDFEIAGGLQTPVAIFEANSTSYSQIGFQNRGSASASSTDFIAYSDNGVDASGYIDMGITSSAFSDPNFTITGPNDGYIFMVAPQKFTTAISSKALTANVATLGTVADHNFRVGMPVVITGVDGIFNGSYTVLATPTTRSFTYAKTNANISSTSVSPNGTAVAGVSGKGNLVLGTSNTGTQNRIVFAAGGLADNNTQMYIDPDLAVYIAIPTQSTSTTTGALVVNGGLGLTGNLNVGGNVNITGTISFTGGGTTVQTANIAVVNPAIFVADTNSANLLDFTFAGGYTASGQKYAAFTKKASDGVWNLVSGLTVKPGNTVDYTNAVYDTLKVGKVTVTTTTPTTAAELTSKAYVDGQRADLELAILMGALA